MNTEQKPRSTVPVALGALRAIHARLWWVQLWAFLVALPMTVLLLSYFAVAVGVYLMYWSLKVLSLF